MDQKEITERALTVPEKAKAIIIKSNEDFQKAGEILTIIKELRKEINESYDPIIKKAHATHLEAVEQKRKVEAPLVEAEGIIKPRLAAWNAEQEKIRRAEEERLQEIARKEEQERRLKEAVAAEQAGHKEEAQAIIDTPIQAPPVVVPKSVPKVAGVSFTKQWKFRIKNPALVPREYMTVDEVKIGKVVRALKDQTSIPGVEVYSEDGVSGRAAA